MDCKFITCHVRRFCSVSDNAAKSFAGKAIWPVQFPGTPPLNQQPPFHKPAAAGVCQSGQCSHKPLL